MWEISEATGQAACLDHWNGARLCTLPRGWFGSLQHVPLGVMVRVSAPTPPHFDRTSGLYQSCAELVPIETAELDAVGEQRLAAAAARCAKDLLLALCGSWIKGV